MPTKHRHRSQLKQRLLRGGAWVFAARMILVLTGLATSMLLARLLGPEDLGVYFLVANLVAMGSAFALLGQGTAVVRLVSESLALDQPGRARQAVEIVLKNVAIGGLVVGVLIAIQPGRWLAGTVLGSEPLVAALGFGGFWVFVRAVQRSLGESFRGFHDLKLSSLFGGVVSGVTTVAVLGFMYFYLHGGTLSQVLLVTIGSLGLSALFAGVILFARVRKLRGERPLSSAKVLKYSLPMLTAQLTSVVLVKSDLWILGGFHSVQDVAIYGAAVQLITVVAVPAMMVQPLMSSTISELFSKGEMVRLESVMRVSASLVFIPVFCVTVLLVGWGGSLLSLIFGEFYSQGALVLAILCIPRLIASILGSNVSLLMMTNHQRIAANIMIIGATVQIVLALFLTRFYGIYGLASAVAVGSLFTFALMYIYVRRTLKIQPCMTLTPWRLLRKSAGVRQRRN